MPALAELLDGGQLSALARLQAALVTQPPAPAQPAAAAVCGECGRPLPPPEAVFLAPGRSA